MVRKTKAVSKITPLGDRLVVRPIEREEISKGGLFLPDTAKEKPQEGEVVAVGPGKTSENGTRLPVEVAVGDRVIFAKYSGTEVKIDDEKLLLMHESDILVKKI
ncbi:MAG: co-chaperone GroES [Chloroflexi bacterium]|nr:co-chaperone GroES [Chloroflexota bacterium]